MKQFGFDSILQLLEDADTAATAVSTKRKRTKITAAIRKKVEKLLKSGHTVKAVSEKAGISAPSVNLIKAKAGLTKTRKPKVKAVTKRKEAATHPRKSLPAPVAAPAEAAAG